MTKLQQWSRPSALEQLETWARADASDADLAKRIGIKPHILRGWQDRCPPIAAAIERGRDRSCALAESALLKRAVGYLTTETRTTEGGRSTDGQVVTVEKFVPPDVRALVFFLKNRMPDRWKERGDKHREPPAEHAAEDPFVAAIRASVGKVWGEGGDDGEALGDAIP